MCACICVYVCMCVCVCLCMYIFLPQLLSTLFLRRGLLLNLELTDWVSELQSSALRPPHLSLSVLMLGLQVSFCTWPFHRESELGHLELLVDILPSSLLSHSALLRETWCFVLLCFVSMQFGNRDLGLLRNACRSCRASLWRQHCFSWTAWGVSAEKSQDVWLMKDLKTVSPFRKFVSD